ncbi:MAG: chemotaxis-specific protein-glutamate methyltransferase CheB [Helicobacteraceae bacterium]|jgi:two-component system chemotaxis response regulator CheB|nr:chemotaxis-specific protein-glutamate methyltransferase CheB [Helicobacteraceae bacterium]
MAVNVLIFERSEKSHGVAAFDILKKAPDINVIGVAKEVLESYDKANKLNPDVIVIDAESRKTGGAYFLQQFARRKRSPIVFFTPLQKGESPAVLEALEIGAIDFAIKPRAPNSSVEKELIDKVLAAAKAKIRPSSDADRVKTTAKVFSAEKTKKVIAIGASTGGTEALKEALIRMPENVPGIVIVQHMPAAFTKPFAQRLDSLCAINVKEAEDGDEALTNLALIAPGNRHMVLRKSASKYYVEIISGDKVSGHRPSVDVLFNSVAECAGANAVGAILTGMGGDGARGLLKMRKAGAKTVAQDEKTCVVFGMPKVAIELGGVDKIVPLEMVASAVMQFVAEIGV